MNLMFYLLIGLIAVILGVLIFGKFFSPAARETRRRRRNYGRTVTKVNRPMVKFTVDVPDKKE